MTAPTQTLRPWQTTNVETALAASATPGTRRLWVSPTGTGKGTAQLAVLAALAEAGIRAYLTTPSGEIARGMLDRLGATDPGEELSSNALWKKAEAAGVYSPVRLRNRLQKNKIPAPDVLVVDEAHHVTAASVKVWETLVEAIGDAPVLGWTATPFRGTHKETEALRTWWGEPETLVTIPEAAAADWLSIPEPEVWPLLDDAGVRIKGGEYDSEEAAEATREQRATERLIERIQAEGWVPYIEWDRPTLISVASVQLAEEIAKQLSDAGIPTEAISGETPRAERDRLLAGCRQMQFALIQVQVLAEGVDMPWLRRLIDLRPLRSPVAWMQLLGRITRPIGTGEDQPEYICCCRNAERHGYLFTGSWPSRELAQETQAKMGEGKGSGGGGPLRRGVAKDALGGRAVSHVPLLGGGHAEVVHIARQIGWDKQEEVLAVVIPGEEKPRCYRRDITGSNGGRDWGRWETTTLDPEGYRGWKRPCKQMALSEKMEAWWRRSGAAKGLDPNADITRREFAVLPALFDSKTSLLPQSHKEAGERAVMVRTEQPDAKLNLPAMMAEVEKLVGSIDAEIEKYEADDALPATWAKLRDGGGWGARLADAAARYARPGRKAEMRRRDGTTQMATLGEIVTRGEGWALARVTEEKPPGLLPEGRFAIEDEDNEGTLRFLISKDGTLYEQAGPAIYAITDRRAKNLANLVERVGLHEACLRYGKELGVCGRCGRALTSEWRHEGIGPVCATKEW